jgi:hypothetical protein
MATHSDLAPVTQRSYWVPFGWAAVIFFGIAAILLLVRLITKNELSLSPEGFTVTNLGRTATTPWTHVESFGVMSPGGRARIVGYNFVEGLGGVAGMRRAARSRMGYEALLPDTYGLKPEELARLMNDWRERSPSSEQV